MVKLSNLWMDAHRPTQMNNLAEILTSFLRVSVVIIKK